MGGKRRVKWYSSLLAVLLCAAFLAGCGAKKSEMTSSGAADYYGEAPSREAPAEANYSMAYADQGYKGEAEVSMEEAPSTPGAEAGAGSLPNQDNRKLIRTASISMETREFDVLISKLTEEVKYLGGYIENSEVSGSSYGSSGSRNAWYTIRIPARELDQFLTAVGDLGNITNKSENVRDITLEYVDTESHKEALRTEQKRLLELLEKAENMEEILQIESRLSEVRYELQSYESQLRSMDNQVDYSTVSLSIYEVERETSVEKKTFFQEVLYGLSDNFYDIGQGFRSFAIWFLTSLPYFLIWAVVIIVIVIIIKRLLRKKPHSGKKGKNGAAVPQQGGAPAQPYGAPTQQGVTPAQPGAEHKTEEKK